MQEEGHAWRKRQEAAAADGPTEPGADPGRKPSDRGAAALDLRAAGGSSSPRAVPLSSPPPATSRRSGDECAKAPLKTSEGKLGSSSVPRRSSLCGKVTALWRAVNLEEEIDVEAGRGEEPAAVGCDDAPAAVSSGKAAAAAVSRAAHSVAAIASPSLLKDGALLRAHSVPVRQPVSQGDREADREHSIKVRSVMQPGAAGEATSHVPNQPAFPSPSVMVIGSSDLLADLDPSRDLIMEGQIGSGAFGTVRWDVDIVFQPGIDPPLSDSLSQVYHARLLGALGVKASEMLHSRASGEVATHPLQAPSLCSGSAEASERRLSRGFPVAVKVVPFMVRPFDLLLKLQYRISTYFAEFRWT